MTKEKGEAWTEQRVAELAPDDRSIPAAREVLKKGGFGTVEATADGRGWWVVCRGITDTYQVSARRNEENGFDCDCTCPSPKYPCKHALALLLYLAQHPELRAEAEAPKAAATDFEALLRGVFRNPEDDTPRLVFADFLEENDQPDRAALIRYQCEQSREKPNSKRYRELSKLINPLLAKLRKEIEPLPEGVDCEFRRGFLWVNGDLGDFRAVGSLPARFTNLFRDGRVETLATGYYFFGMDGEDEQGMAALIALVGELDVSRYPLPDESLVRLVANTVGAMTSGRLARVKVHRASQKAYENLLRVHRGEAISAAGPTERARYHNGLTPMVLDLLVRAGRLSGCRELHLSSAPGALSDADVSTLLSADLGQLESLNLTAWKLTYTGLAEIANTSALPRLTELFFNTCRFAPGAVAALGGGPGLTRLRSLQLVECSLTDADVIALANAAVPPDLTHVGLYRNAALTHRGATAVLASKNFPKLTGLNLHGSAIDQPDQLPLALDAPDRPGFTTVFDRFAVLRRVFDGEVEVEIEARGSLRGRMLDRLGACAGAKRVTQLSARRLDLDAGAMPALAAGFDPEKLWRLDLTDNRLRNDGTAALARAFAKFKLKELNLSHCRIQSAGVAALIASPLVNTLRTLDLSGNNVGKAGAAALAKGEVPRALEELILSDCRLGESEKKQLKAKFGAKVKL